MLKVGPLHSFAHFNAFNLPKAIRNLATPLVTPRSDRPGFCNVNGHTTVCQTGVFFSIIVWI